MPQIHFLPDWLSESLLDVRHASGIWLVGGAIRDRLLGLESMDYDFAVDGEARSIARRLADRLGGQYYDLDRARDTGRVIYANAGGGETSIDFARLRGQGIAEDLFWRDFTINALALGLSDPGQLIDPTGGLQDLKDHLLRACGPSSLQSDPIRCLRAVRFAFQFELQIEDDTLAQIRAFSPDLLQASDERIRDELFCIFDLPQPGRAMRLMDHLGLLSILFPELDALRGVQQPPPHEFDAWGHTLAVADRLGLLLEVLAPDHDPQNASELVWGEIAYRLGRFGEGIHEHLERGISYDRKMRPLLFFAALFHDSGKSSCVTLKAGRIGFIGHEAVGAKLACARAMVLKLSNAELQHLDRIIRHHMRPAHLAHEPELTRRAVHRFYRQTGEAAIDVVLLSLADLLGKQTPPINADLLSAQIGVAQGLLSAYFQPSGVGFNAPALVRGDELAEALGIAPGPEIGRLLAAIEEARFCGEIESRHEALRLARKLHSEKMDEKGAENGPQSLEA